MIVGGQTEARAQLSSTIIDYHEPFDQGLRAYYIGNFAPSSFYQKVDRLIDYIALDGHSQQ